MKKVFGKYTNAAEARRAVDELLVQGYKNDEIKVVSNRELGDELNYFEGDVEKDHENLWEKIKDAFTFDKYDEEYWDRELDEEERKLLEEYRENLKSGEIIVLVTEGSSRFRDYFRDGVPDWDEREKEFIEDED